MSKAGRKQFGFYRDEQAVIEAGRKSAYNKKWKSEHWAEVKEYMVRYRKNNAEHIKSVAKVNSAKKKHYIQVSNRMAEKKRRREVSDRYVKNCIHKCTGLPSGKITSEMVENRRLMIMNHRITKEIDRCLQNQS